MAVKHFYIGGMGPYLFDDTIPLLDLDNYFPGENQYALITDGRLNVNDGVIANKITESFASTGTINKYSQMIFADGTYDLFLPTIANSEDYVYEIKNIGTGVITIKPNANEPTVEIDNEISQPLRTEDCISIINDDSNWWVI